MPVDRIVMFVKKTLCTNKLHVLLLGLLLSALSHSTPSQTDGDLRALLDEVKTHIASDAKTDLDRLTVFRKNKQDQVRLLTEARNRLKKAELMQEFLKETFDQNEDFIAEKNELLITRSGQLGEVFGVVKQQAKDLSGVLQDSQISAEFPNRLEALEFADKKRIPSLKELENLWFLLQQEMTASAEIKKIKTNITLANGQHKESEVLRIGPFSAITSQGEFLQYLPDDQRLRVLPRQPSQTIQTQAADFYNGQHDSLVIDPSRGNLLELLGRTPTLKERIQQGGLIGYIIISLGVIGLLVALWRLLTIISTDAKVTKQLKQMNSPINNNPLGRIFIAASIIKSVSAEKNKSAEAIQNEKEIRIDEALLKEAPKLERGLTLLKLIAAVAPLLGLLGTVTGMIGTFQSITLFGTSDPKMMAGGISQALMTTVLGLCVAIPLLFGHSLIAARTRALLQLLQQKTLALTLDNDEQPNNSPTAKLNSQPEGLPDAA